MFEDAPNGVDAAHAAGMQCVWVPHNQQDRDTHKHKCTQILDSLELFKPEEFGLPPYDSWYFIGQLDQSICFYALSWYGKGLFKVFALFVILLYGHYVILNQTWNKWRSSTVGPTVEMTALYCNSNTCNWSILYLKHRYAWREIIHFLQI